MKWIKITVLVVLMAIFGFQLATGQPAELQERPSIESKSGNGTLERLGAWPYGPSLATAVDEIRNLTFLGSGGAVLVLGTDDPTGPELISNSLRSDGLVLGLEYDPNTQRLYIAAHEAGLEIWDLADPSNPTRLSRTEIYYVGVEIPINDVALNGNYAILDGNFGYVHSVDISDPTNPIDVSFNGAGGNPTIGVYADGNNHAYACGPKFQRFVIQANGALDSAGFFDNFPSLCGDFTVDNDTNAYVGAGGYLYILDLLNPFYLPWSITNVGGVKAIQFRADRAYIINGSGIHIYDVSDVTNPILVGETDTPGFKEDLVVAGNYAYIADHYRGLQIVDISDETQPQIVGSYDGLSVTSNTVISGNYAYLSMASNGFMIVDISDKVTPQVIGQYDSPGYTNDVAVSGNYAYAADSEGGLRIVDVSNPSQPVEVGFYDDNRAWNVAVSGNYAYIADFNSALRILDISDPTNPLEVGMLPISDIIWELFLDGNYVYIANNDSGVRIIDVSDPAQPAEIGSYAIPDVHDVVVRDDVAFVASTDWVGGFLILDVSNPANPIEISLYNPTGWFHPFNVNVSGNYAYLTTPSASQRLYTLDISDLGNPVELDSFSTSGSLSEVTADGPFVYISDGRAGLQIYRNTLFAYQATLGPSSDLTAEPGETVTHTFTLANLGLSDTYTLTVSGHSWPTTLLSPAVVSLGTDEEATITVQVTVPLSPTGTTDTFTLIALSTGDPTMNLTTTGTTTLPDLPPPVDYKVYLPGVWRP